MYCTMHCSKKDPLILNWGSECGTGPPAARQGGPTADSESEAEAGPGRREARERPGAWLGDAAALLRLNGSECWRKRRAIRAGWAGRPMMISVPGVGAGSPSPCHGHGHPPAVQVALAPSQVGEA